MFCPQCGTDTSKHKCPECGYIFSDGLVEKWKEYDKDKYEKLYAKSTKIYCYFSYLYLLGIVSALRTEKTDAMRHHLKQGLVIDIIAVLGVGFLFVPKIGTLIGITLVIVSLFLNFLGISGLSKEENEPLPVVKNIIDFFGDIEKRKEKDKS